VSRLELLQYGYIEYIVKIVTHKYERFILLALEYFNISASFGKTGFPSVADNTGSCGLPIKSAFREYNRRH
jgi:hypothetical protein